MKGQSMMCYTVMLCILADDLNALLHLLFYIFDTVKLETLFLNFCVIGRVVKLLLCAY